MKLSDQYLRIAAFAQLRADWPLDRLALALKLRPHVVRRAIQSMTELGYLSKRVFLNTYRLGLMNYGFLFSVAETQHKNQNRLIQWLIQNDTVNYIEELGGDVQYYVEVMVESTSQVISFLDELGTKFPVGVSRKGQVQMCALEDYPLTLLTGGRDEIPPFVLGVSDQIVDIDEVDHKVLSIISNSEFESDSIVARKLRLPESTVRYRIKRLQEKGVVVGTRYVVDLQKLGYQLFNCNLLFKWGGPQIHERVRSFCREEERIFVMVRTLGSWDYLYTVAVREPWEINEVVRKMERVMGDCLDRVTVVSNLRLLKLTPYPFHIDRPYFGSSGSASTAVRKRRPPQP